MFRGSVADRKNFLEGETVAVFLPIRWSFRSDVGGDLQFCHFDLLFNSPTLHYRGSLHKSTDSGLFDFFDDGSEEMLLKSKGHLQTFSRCALYNFDGPYFIFDSDWKNPSFVASRGILAGQFFSYLVLDVHKADFCGGVVACFEGTVDGWK